MAVSCCVVPSGITVFPEATVIEASVAAETVSASDPLMVPDPAVTVAVPTCWPVASPEVLTPKIPPGELVQEMEFVRFCVLPSVYVPCAVSCTCAPNGIVERFVPIEIETSAGGRMVSGVDAFTDPLFAVIVVTPIEVEFAPPLELTTAIFGAELAQVTEFVTSCVLWSL